MNVMFVLREFNPRTGLSKFVAEVTRRMPDVFPILVTNRVVGPLDDKHLSHLSIREIGGASFSLPFKSAELSKIAKAERVDVISLHGGFLTSLAIPRLSRIGLPIVFTSHTTKLSMSEFSFMHLSDYFREYKILLDFGDVILSLILPRRLVVGLMGSERLKSVTYPTDEESKVMKQYLGDKHVSRLSVGGADTGLFTPGEVATNPYVLFFGRARLIRGIDTTISAFEEVAKNRKGVRLKLCLLPDQDLDAVKTLVTRSPVRDLIDLSWDDRKDMNTLLSGARVVVLPFRWPRAMPSQPLTLLEGMSAGCACISTPIAGIRGIIDNGVNGFLLSDPRDYKGCAGLINRALDGDMGALRMRARDTVIDHYSWQSIADNLESELREAISGTRARATAMSNLSNEEAQ
jgi:glycosyltransferase involved in cell wall biosynthesis